MMTIFKWLMAAAFICFTLCWVPRLQSVPNEVSRTEASLVLVGGKIYTVDPAQPWAEAMAVQGQTILLVGTNSDVERFVGQHTKRLDLDGRLVLPGFVSTHEHPLAALITSIGLMIEPQPDGEAMIAQLRTYAHNNPDLDVIVSFGGADLGKVTITREMLDAAIPDRAAFMIASSGHGGWANSKALALAGVKVGTADPVPSFERDTNGRPTGLVGSSPAAFYTIVALNIVNRDDLLRVHRNIFELFTEFGITAVYDAGVPPGLEGPVFSAVHELEQEGKLPFRIVASCKLQLASQAADTVEKLRRYATQYQSHVFAVNTLKVHGDGVLEGRTAGLIEDYADAPGERGYVAMEGDALSDLLLQVSGDGFDVHIHAIGDRTARVALDSFAAVRAAGFSDTRLSLGHVQLVSDADMSRFASLNVVASTTPIWHSPYQLTQNRLGVARAARTFRFQSLVKQGAKVTIGTDFPATGIGVAGLNPFLNIAVGMERRPPSSTGERLPPEDERMTLNTLIRGYTIDAAYQIHLDEVIGSLKAGKLADFVVLDRNIFEITPPQIAETKVLMTVMNGNVQHDLLFGLGDATPADQSIKLNCIEDCDAHTFSN